MPRKRTWVKNKAMKRLLHILLALIPTSLSAQNTNLDSIESQMRYAAKQGLLDRYYPANIDTVYGGYISTFSYDITPVEPQDKMIVTQARHTWSTAKAAMFYHDTSYIPMSRHGFYFLQDKMWDKQYGGFYNLVSRDGTPKSIYKEAYGNAFAIYG